MQDAYVADTASCAYYAGGGTASGAAGMGAAALLGSNPYGFAVLTVGAVGTGLGAWGASACYSDAAVVKEQNLATCGVLLAKLKMTCEQEEAERRRKIEESGQEGGSGGGGGSRDGNSGRYNGSTGSGCGTKCRKGTVDIW